MENSSFEKDTQNNFSVMMAWFGSNANAQRVCGGGTFDTPFVNPEQESRRRLLTGSLLLVWEGCIEGGRYAGQMVGCGVSRGEMFSSLLCRPTRQRAMDSSSAAGNKTKKIARAGGGVRVGSKG